MTSFQEMGLEPSILQKLEELGFENPMPIQEQAIPFLLQNDRDLIALAQTGTGKTAAFGLPLLQTLDITNNHTQALILCPTRELCIQISGDLERFSEKMKNVRVLPVYGGASIVTQIRGIKRGAHIVIATPGRMLDLINRKEIDFSHVKTVVLDEADEMLNMGFKEDLDAILVTTPKEKRIALFSATMPDEISRIASTYMRSPEKITVGSKNSGSDSIKHVLYEVADRNRYLTLKRIVDMVPDVYGIIFCRTKISTQDIADKLLQDGYDADALHGDLSQAQRDAVMQKFRRRNLHLLVATDVAARGLDVNDLTHVINYDMPDDPDTYIHRSGRTGRAGKDGISIIISGRGQGRLIQFLERKLKKEITRATVPSGKDICEKQLFHFIDRIQQADVNEELMAEYLPSIYAKFESMEREDIIKHFVSLEFNRFLDYYKDLSDPEPVSKGGVRGLSVRLRVNLGHKDNITVPRLIKLVNEKTRNRDIPIGRIDIQSSVSFMEMQETHATQVVSALDQTSFQGRQLSAEISGGFEPQGRKPYRKSAERSTPYRERPTYGGDRSFHSGEKRTFQAKKKRTY